MIEIDRRDIRGVSALSIDLRSMTSTGVEFPDETQLCDPGVFVLSVFWSGDGTPPVGEIRIMQDGIEVSVVGHLTDREGVVEVTPDHLSACRDDNSYRQSVLGWIRTHAQ